MFRVSYLYKIFTIANYILYYNNSSSYNFMLRRLLLQLFNNVGVVSSSNSLILHPNKIKSVLGVFYTLQPLCYLILLVTFKHCRTKLKLKFIHRFGCAVWRKISLAYGYERVILFLIGKTTTENARKNKYYEHVFCYLNYIWIKQVKHLIKQRFSMP